MLTITKVIGVFFSTTGNAEQIVLESGEYIAHNLGIPFESENFTKHDEQTEVRSFSEGDLVIFGTPIYDGRIPNKILQAVQTLFQGNGAFAVPMVTFGSSTFDNSLVDLASELKKNNFSILAAGACACKHSFSEIGLDRPNVDDRKHREAFCTTVVDKVFTASLPLEELEIKGKSAAGGYALSGGLDQPVKNAFKPMTANDTKGSSSLAVSSMHGIANRKQANTTGNSSIKFVTPAGNKPKSVDKGLLSHNSILEQEHTAPAISEFFL